MTFQQVRDRFFELLGALIAVFIVVNLAGNFTERERDLLPASAWFEVNEVFVPDHRTGSNPNMIYDRAIHEDFRGFFVVEVQQQQENGLWFAACSGSGVGEYETTDYIPERTVTWEWFLNRECDVGPGRYRLRTSFEMRRPGWPTKSLVHLSNVFNVTD